jgi:hypothetical protein
VVAPENPDGVELVLHLADEPARAFQHASRERGRPVLSLHTDDCQRDAERLKANGVVFVKEPGRMPYSGIDAVRRHLRQPTQPPPGLTGAAVVPHTRGRTTGIGWRLGPAPRSIGPWAGHGSPIATRWDPGPT